VAGAFKESASMVTIRHVGVAVMVASLGAGGCARTVEHTTTYTPGGQVSDRTIAQNDQILASLHRVFDATVLTGEGVFDNANEGLARAGALNLAIADVAQKVQSQVRANTVIYNNQDIRSVVETNVNALVQGYSIDGAGLDAGSTKYRVRVSVRGEQLVKEIERRRVENRK
jgi:hypothetical protein